MEEQSVEAHGAATVPPARLVVDPWPQTERALSVPVPEVDARATLVVMAGPGAGRVLALTERDFLLGRGPAADLSFEDHGVSRSHLRVGHDAEGHFIEDLGSTNGTFLRGQRVSSARLASGDRFQLGPVVVVRFAVADRLERELLERLVESSTRDSLTGAFSRRFFLERLGSEVAFAQRHGTKVAVLMVDLDHFKAINDGYGHPAGDRLLRDVATAMGRTLRAEDVLGRYGGEEFSILARAATRLDALRLAERIRSSVASVVTPVAGGVARVTASVGVARLGEHADARTPARLLELADARLYRAKAEGRNRVCAVD